jgi:hypothetical protein
MTVLVEKRRSFVVGLRAVERNITGRIIYRGMRESSMGTDSGPETR